VSDHRSGFCRRLRLKFGRNARLRDAGYTALHAVFRGCQLRNASVETLDFLKVGAAGREAQLLKPLQRLAGDGIIDHVGTSSNTLSTFPSFPHTQCNVVHAARSDTDTP
jgi:hypothetical protein